MFLNRSEKSLLKELIKIPSVTGKEEGVISFLKHLFDRAKWLNFEIKVEEDSAGILVVFGTPKILFTTHVDVVDGPLNLFEPSDNGSTVFGRGACDAKGSIVSMIFACDELVKSGATDFGLFLFAGEERGGKTVLSCMNYLQGFGIEHVVMGEPTKCKMARSHLGALCLNVKFFGQAALSGYLNDGIDANKILVSAAQKLYSLDESLLGFNGIWSVNLGRLYGGLSPNTLSPFAAMEVYIRTTMNNHADIIALVQSVAPEAKIEVMFSGLRKDLVVLEGYETTEAKMCSSLPHFESLGANLMMLGPGDPKLAHSNEERIAISELVDAKELYLKLYDDLSNAEPEDFDIDLPENKNEELWYS